MAKRNSGSNPVTGTAKSGSAKKRPPLTVVKKPKPWGTIIGGAVLALALIGIVAYAATNQGSGFESPIKVADEKFSGLSVTEDPARDHVEGAVAYETVPPVGGEHNSLPQQCDVYTEPIPNEHAVHSLEHGAVWVTYNDDLPEGDVEKLVDVVDGDPYGLLSPVPDQESPVMVTAWGRQLALDTADDSRIDEFFDTYKSGPQTPERGAACVGNATTGSLGTPAADQPGQMDPPSEPAASVAPSAPVPSEPVEPSPTG